MGVIVKRAITLFLVIAVILGGVFVSCKKTTTNEDLKKKIETNSENQKNINRKLIKPIMRKQIDVRKLRRALKKKKNRDEKVVGAEAEKKIESKEEKAMPDTKEVKTKAKVESIKKAEKKEVKPAEKTEKKK